MTPKTKFSYPLNCKYDYKFPDRYYDNITLGNRIIKHTQVIISEPVKIGPKGILDNSNELESK